MLDDLRLRPSAVTKAERGHRLFTGEAVKPVKAHAVALDRSMPAIEAARALVGSALEQLQANEEGVLASPDAEFVHQARVALRRSRKVPYNKPDDFDYNTSDLLIENFHNIVGMIALAVTVISSVGLMIGGVGVMNIMLVSVTERTREIGVRKAIGARRSDITWQFLLEAMTLTGSGGVLGILAGVTLSFLIRTFVPSLPSTVPAWAVVMGFVASVSIGLFFGIWPAVKASRLDPIVALHYE